MGSYKFNKHDFVSWRCRTKILSSPRNKKKKCLISFNFNILVQKSSILSWVMNIFYLKYFIIIGKTALRTLLQGPPTMLSCRIAFVTLDPLGKGCQISAFLLTQRRSQWHQKCSWKCKYFLGSHSRADMLIIPFFPPWILPSVKKLYYTLTLCPVLYFVHLQI